MSEELEVKSNNDIAKRKTSRITVIGDSDSEKYEFVKKQIILEVNKIRRKNKPDYILILTDSNSAKTSLFKNINKRINMDTFGLCEANLKELTIVHGVNVFYGFNDIYKLDFIISKIKIPSDTIVIFDGLDKLLSDNERRKRSQNVESLFKRRNVKIFYITQNFPENKLDLIEAYPFDFIFFSPFSTGGHSCKRYTVVKTIFKIEAVKKKLYDPFIGFINRKADNEFVYLKHGELDTLYRGTTAKDDYSDNESEYESESV